MTTVLPVVIGLAIILTMLRDIFLTLFHPSAQSAISSRGIRHVWGLFRLISRNRPEMLSMAGPSALIAIIVMWTLSLATGWALVIWPFLPTHFLLSSGLEASGNTSFADAMYMSLVNLSTLGYGDITPVNTWLRLAAPVESLIGFGLISAAISWILSVTPILTRQRHLAREVSLVQGEGRWDAALAAHDAPSVVIGLLHSFTEQVVRARSDYEHLPITYYFRQSERDAALDIALPRLAMIADTAATYPSGAVQAEAELLRVAVRDLAILIGDSFLDMDKPSLEEIFVAYAGDHLRRPARAASDAAAVLER